MSEAAAPRGRDEVLADAVRVLTEAARLRRPALRQAADGGGWEPDPSQTEPADWAEFITQAVAGAAANIGSVEKALEGRPGSWEADAVRSMLLSTVGEDPADLLRHRTEPVRVVLRPAEILSDLGYTALYDESRQILQAQQDRHVWHYRLGEDRTWTPLDPGAPDWADAFDVPENPSEALGGTLPPGTVTTVPRSAEDEAAYDVLADQEAALEDMEYEDDPRAYGEALTAVVLAQARRRYPGITVETAIDIERTWRDDSLYQAPEDELINAAIEQAPLPWSGIAPRDYPPGRAIADTERAACRLPHLRLGDTGRGGPVMITLQELRQLTGCQVRMGFEDSMFGETTLRWGTLREISPDGKTLTIDGYHDSAGFGLDSTSPTDGTPVEVGSLRFIERHYPGVVR